MAGAPNVSNIRIAETIKLFLMGKVDFTLFTTFTLTSTDRKSIVAFGRNLARQSGARSTRAGITYHLKPSVMKLSSDRSR
jgi:hypothetical protein